MVEFTNNECMGVIVVSVKGERIGTIATAGPSPGFFRIELTEAPWAYLDSAALRQIADKCDEITRS